MQTSRGKLKEVSRYMITLIIMLGLFAAIMFFIDWAEDKTCPKCGGYMIKVYGWDKEECTRCHFTRNI